MRKMWKNISEIIHKQKNNHISIKKYASKKNLSMTGQKLRMHLTIVFVNIDPNLTKNITQKDQSHISYRKYINASILSSFNFQLIDYESLK